MPRSLPGFGCQTLTDLDDVAGQLLHVDVERCEHSSSRAVSVVEQCQHHVDSVWASAAERTSNLPHAAPQQMQILSRPPLHPTLPLIQHATEARLMSIQNIPDSAGNRTRRRQQVDATQLFVAPGGEGLGLGNQIRK